MQKIYKFLLNVSELLPVRNRLPAPLASSLDA